MKWIDVEDEKPKEGSNVLTIDKTIKGNAYKTVAKLFKRDVMYTAKYENETFILLPDIGLYGRNYNPTHWRELPKLPIDRLYDDEADAIEWIYTHISDIEEMFDLSFYDEYCPDKVKEQIETSTDGLITLECIASELSELKQKIKWCNEYNEGENK